MCAHPKRKNEHPSNRKCSLILEFGTWDAAQNILERNEEWGARINTAEFIADTLMWHGNESLANI